MKTIFTLISAAILAGGAAQAETIDADAPRSERVGVADLNLVSAEGRTRLDARIRAAARRVCREPAGATLHGLSLRQSCFEPAVRGGFRQRDRIYAERGIIAGMRVAQARTGRD